jgi:lysozyme family protein
MNFDKAFDELLGHEGKYSNHPSDPGGETMWGVTKRVAVANGYKGDMKDMPVDFAKVVYRKDYWDAVRADELPDVVRYAVFDGAVNSGVSQSVKWLQEAVGAAVDGRIGPQTIMFAKMSEPEETLRKMLGARLRFMTDLNTWDYFSRGWARRIASLLKGLP